ncbi:hypothetical protein SDC9_153142 [bioreactor metagenome]|uniref:Uncharacterized protein n=1 Tax=bioreactor metagenome TaxID=1076179 RepID=A0A645EV19_9ZZZZ
MGGTLFKIKIAKKNPCAATHLLIYPEVGFAAGMIYTVPCIVATVFDRLIRDKHRISPFLRNIGCPGGDAFLTP